MAFQQFKLERSINQTRNIFDKYIYHPANNDLLADILAAGYFDQSRFIDSDDWIGSIIEISASDGYAIGRIVSGGIVSLYNSSDGGGGTTYQNLTDTESFMGNAKKVPLVSDAETELVYTTKFTFDDTLGYLGVGTTPGKNIDILNTTASAEIRLKSDLGKGVVILDGVATGDGSNVGEVSFRDDGDSIAIIDGERDAGAQSGSLNFRTQTDLGVMTSHMKIDSKGSFFLYDLAETSASANPLLRIDPSTKEIKFDSLTKYTESLTGSGVDNTDPQNPVILEKQYFFASSSSTVTVGTDPDAPSFLTGMAIDEASTGLSNIDLNGAVINNSGRVIKAMSGTISFQPDKDGGGTTLMSLWSERSGDGVTWVQNSESLRTIETSNNGETFKTSISAISSWQAGHYLRFRVYSSGGGTVDFVPPTDTVLGGQTIVGASVIWSLSEL